MDRLVFLRRGVAEFARQRAPAPQPGQFGRRCAAPPVRHFDTFADLENETNRLCQVRSGQASFFVFCSPAVVGSVALASSSSS